MTTRPRPRQQQRHRTSQTNGLIAKRTRTAQTSSTSRGRSYCECEPWGGTDARERDGLLLRLFATRRQLLAQFLNLRTIGHHRVGGQFRAQLAPGCARLTVLVALPPSTPTPQKSSADLMPG